MSIKIGFCGLGSFSRSFVPLFKADPWVSEMVLCDLEPDRVKAACESYGIERACLSLDELCATDVDAVVIMTQPWLHAPQAAQVMESGKHVYSAVPIYCVPDGDEILDWCDRIIETSRRTGQYYMLGETTYFRPQAMYCRRRAAEGAFGSFVYAEGEYFHDVDCRSNLREVRKHRSMGRAGQEWEARKQEYLARGLKEGPMHYPTHSSGGPVCVMQAHATKVTCYGFRNRTGDPFFKDSEFSNETALFEMSNGAVVRLCEYREIGHPGEETFRIFGTKGSYIDWTWQDNMNVERLEVPAMRDALPPEVFEAFSEGDPTRDFYGGHGGSHAYLAHEFVDAVVSNRQPAINAWEAARYMVMGVMAHKSALRDGERLDVPDWGDAPQ